MALVSSFEATLKRTKEKTLKAKIMNKRRDMTSMAALVSFLEATRTRTQKRHMKGKKNEIKNRNDECDCQFVVEGRSGEVRSSGQQNGAFLLTRISEMEDTKRIHNHDTKTHKSQPQNTTKRQKRPPKYNLYRSTNTTQTTNTNYTHITNIKLPQTHAQHTTTT